MNREGMRNLLRRRLVDDAVLTFDDDVLNDALNQAATFVQADIEQVAPGSFLTITTQSIVADDAIYQKPEGIWSLVELAIKDASTGRYRSLGTPVTLDQLRSLENADGSSGVTRFGFFGESIMLSPTPSASVTAGLRWIFDRSAQMAEDDDVCPIHLGLHQAVVLRAQMLLMPESVGEASKELRTLLAEEMGRVPVYYRQTLAQQVPLHPNIDKMGRR